MSLGLTAIADVAGLQTVAQNGRVHLFVFVHGLLNVEQCAAPVDTGDSRHVTLVVLVLLRRCYALEHKRWCGYARATDDENSMLPIGIGNAQHCKPSAPRC